MLKVKDGDLDKLGLLFERYKTQLFMFFYRMNYDEALSEDFVQNVNGEMDVNFINGDITMVNVSGSAVVSTQNGDVKVNFTRLKENTPMAFSTFNGEVDITFPASLKATVKMRSDHGNLFSDFDMEIKKSSPKIDDNREDGVYKIVMEEWVMGDINGGGPEVTFKTYSGDILIRKK